MGRTRMFNELEVRELEKHREFMDDIAVRFQAHADVHGSCVITAKLPCRCGQDVCDGELEYTRIFKPARGRPVRDLM